MSVSKSFEDDEDDFNESSLIHTRIPGKKVKVTQINYISRNQLHHIANCCKNFVATEKTEKIMPCFGSALYLTEIEKFVYHNQQCFAVQISCMEK